MSLLNFNKVTKIFKADIFGKKFKALDELDFTIENGGLIGFLGANGAGKTTSIKILMGFIRKDSGEVKFSQEMGKNQSEILSNIGYFPERPYFYPHLTGREFLNYVGKLNNVEKNRFLKSIEYWGDRLKISFAYDRKIYSYSKGMLQRLGFVSTLVHDPKLLILDEPLAGLDPIGRKEIKDVMRELKNEGKTVFFSSHIVSDVEEVCEKVVVIEKGKLIYQGPINSVLQSTDDKNVEISFLGNTHEEFKEYGRHTSGDLITIEVPKLEKNTVLNKLIEQNCEIISLHQHRITLEEFVYKVRK